MYQSLTRGDIKIFWSNTFNTRQFLFIYMCSQKKKWSKWYERDKLGLGILSMLTRRRSKVRKTKDEELNKYHTFLYIPCPYNPSFVLTIWVYSLIQYHPDLLLCLAETSSILTESTPHSMLSRPLTTSEQWPINSSMYACDEWWYWTNRCDRKRFDLYREQASTHHAPQLY